jgi:hypothetical protein
MPVLEYGLQVEKNTGRPYYGVVTEWPIVTPWKGVVRAIVP